MKADMCRMTHDAWFVLYVHLASPSSLRSFLLLATNPYYFLFLDKKKVNKEPSPKGELANTLKK